MAWGTFTLWNAAGGITWATSVGLAAFYGGKGAETVVKDVGTYGAVTLAVLLIAVAATLLVRRRSR